jgi:hypothetical protein
MHLTVTIKHDNELEELKALILAIRQRLTNESVTVWEAPQGMDYPYPLPVVTIFEEENRSRLYGDEAVAKLRDLIRG